MIYLILSIACSTIIFAVFKLFGSFRVNNLYAIIVNYFVASMLGAIALSTNLPDDLDGKRLIPVFLFGGLLGILFILVFRLIALASQQNGLRVASVATKMSLVIPALFGIALLGEPIGFTLIAGVALAISAIILSNYTKGSPLGWNEWRLPFLVFLGAGIVASSINLIRAFYLEDTWFPLFSTVVFFSAGISGSVFIFTNRLAREMRIRRKEWFGGIALGIPNYFSLYFLLKSLDSPSLDSAVVFTVNNVAIVLMSTLLGVLAFREHLNVWNYLGILLAAVSIWAVTT
jgi:drug/metabolite transporter (DMT)-like permease